MKSFKSLVMSLFTLSVLLVPLGGGSTASAASTLTSISLSAPSSISVTHYQNINVDAKYSDNTSKNVNTEASIIASTDEGQVSITKTGALGNQLKMTATKAGFVTVDVSYTEGSITKTAYKNIQVKPALGISSLGIMDVGETYQTVTKYYVESSNPQIVTNTATYSSSDPSVATISSTGFIKAIKTGQSVIKVTYPDTIFGGTLVESYTLRVE